MSTTVALLQQPVQTTSRPYVFNLTAMEEPACLLD
jgi:hypothetical protein